MDSGSTPGMTSRGAHARVCCPIMHTQLTGLLTDLELVKK